MKTSTKTSALKPSPDSKPILQPTKAPTQHPDGLPVHPLLDAWLALPPRQPENLLHVLRNRSN